MEWVFENLQVIIVIAGAVAWWINQRAREKAGEEADYDADGTPEAKPRGEFQDPELSERTRKIREEIQRKIEERRRTSGGEYAPPRQEEPPPVVRRIPESEPPVVVAPPVVVQRRPESQPSASERAAIRRMAEIQEQRAAVAEQLKRAEEMKAAAMRRLTYEQKIGIAKNRSKFGRVLVGELREKEALRRALLLREILGPPVGLR